MPKNKTIMRTSVREKRPRPGRGAWETPVKNTNADEAGEKINESLRRARDRTKVASTPQTDEGYLAGT
jgi:hypothetical protein